MGVQSLQDFISSDNSNLIPLPKSLECLKKDTSNLVLVHGESCFRHFYHENMDWICGGQWSELFQCIEKFVKAFRNTDLELIIFLEGGSNEMTHHQWKTKQKISKEIVKEVLPQIQHNQNTQFRPKVKHFIPPGSFKAALRLAFRACDVTVCSSLEDIYKESILYAKDEHCLGILANDVHYLFSSIPRHLTFGNIKWLKKALNACKVVNNAKILGELSLQIEDLPYLATLLGNHVVKEAKLSGFYWDILEDDSPLKKVKDNLTSPDAALPPSDVRLKCVARFIAEKREEVQNIEKLSQIVFCNNTSISVETGVEILTKAINFYQDFLKAAGSAVCHEKDEANQTTKSGFPLPTALSTVTGSKSKYKSNWKYVVKVKKPKKEAEEKQKGEQTDKATNDKQIEDPEKVLKEGTLEEAAQALEQLELKENEDTKDNETETTSQEITEEKPSVAVQDEEKAADKIDDNDEDAVELPEYSREITMAPVVPSINDEVIAVARKRHQSGQMCPEILNLLTKGEVMLNMAIDDDEETTWNPIPLIFRPLRQLVYGVLFGAKQEVSKVEEKTSEKKDSDDNNEEAEENENEKTETDVKSSTDSGTSDTFSVKEWCVYGNRNIEEEDLVNPKGMSWGVPSLKQLWFGTNSEDNANRLKAFLSCMKSDTINMSNTSMVPQRLMILCCVLRYLVQQEKAVLRKADIDAFLAQALSSTLTSEHNTQNLANLKLNQIDTRCVRLASMFMNGVENAIIANDACGSPVPWEFCCPWNFFDGKLFHAKYLQCANNSNTIDLCEGKGHIAEKLERLRWCITEGLETKYTITGLKENKKFFNPFGNVPDSLKHRPMYGVMRPDGTFPHKSRSRGQHSKRPVHGSGGVLQVAGVPVAHWGGNKAGIGYSKNAPGVVVGGMDSIDLPSNHPRGRRNVGRGSRGRGLLETPYISPWQQGFGYEFLNSTYERYLKGVKKAEEVRSKLGKMKQPRVYSNSNRNQNMQPKRQQKKYQPNQNMQQNQPKPHQQQQQQQHGNQQQYNNKANMWLGKGRGQDPTPISPVKPITNQSYGRGHWMNPSE